MSNVVVHTTPRDGCTLCAHPEPVPLPYAEAYRAALVDLVGRRASRHHHRWGPLGSVTCQDCGAPRDAGAVNVGHAIGACLVLGLVLAAMAVGGALTGVAW